MEKTKKFYSGNSIWLGTSIFSPLAGGYMLYSNSSQLAKKGMGLQLLLLSFLYLLLIFVVAFYTPETQYDKYINTLVTGINGLLAYILFNILQKHKVQEEIEAGAGHYSFGRKLMVGVISLITTVALLLGLVFYVFTSPGEERLEELMTRYSENEDEIFKFYEYY